VGSPASFNNTRFCAGALVADTLADIPDLVRIALE
jgi:hypothetical protein